MSAIKDKIKGARLAERTVPVCLDGALVAEIEAADRELKRLTEQPAGDSLEGNGLRAAAERVEELRRQMQDATEEFRLRALPRKRWKALVGAHPPRKDPETGKVHERDGMGVNSDTFFPALLRVSVISPDLDAEDWVDLLGGMRKREDGTEEEVDGVLTDRQFDELANAAWYLNRDTIDVPFSHAASRILNSAPE